MLEVQLNELVFMIATFHIDKAVTLLIREHISSEQNLQTLVVGYSCALLYAPSYKLSIGNLKGPDLLTEDCDRGWDDFGNLKNCGVPKVTFFFDRRAQNWFMMFLLPSRIQWGLVISASSNF